MKLLLDKPDAINVIDFIFIRDDEIARKGHDVRAKWMYTWKTFHVSSATSLISRQTVSTLHPPNHQSSRFDLFDN